MLQPPTDKEGQLQDVRNFLLCPDANFLDVLDFVRMKGGHVSQEEQVCFCRCSCLLYAFLLSIPCMLPHAVTFDEEMGHALTLTPGTNLQ
jgi:hypothetical protein